MVLVDYIGIFLHVVMWQYFWPHTVCQATEKHRNVCVSLCIVIRYIVCYFVMFLVCLHFVILTHRHVCKTEAEISNSIDVRK
jgi:hypothetical protein